MEIEGVMVAKFKSVEGLDNETKTIILQEGYADRSFFEEWRDSLTEGRVERKFGSIILQAERKSAKIFLKLA